MHQDNHLASTGLLYNSFTEGAFFDKRGVFCFPLCCGNQNLGYILYAHNSIQNCLVPGLQNIKLNKICQKSVQKCSVYLPTKMASLTIFKFVTKFIRLSEKCNPQLISAYSQLELQFFFDRRISIVADTAVLISVQIRQCRRGLFGVEKRTYNVLNFYNLPSAPGPTIADIINTVTVYFNNSNNGERTVQKLQENSGKSKTKEVMEL